MKIKILVSILAVVLATACNNKHTDDSDHDHEHEAQHEEEAKFQYTVYSNECELFAEADPFVIGEECNVLSYFTKLTDFKPLTERKITLKLEVGGKEVTLTKETADHSGIYSFDLIPIEAGTGNLIYEISSAEGSFQVIIPSVTVFTTEEQAHEAAEAHETLTTNTALFTKEQSWKINFRTELPAVEPFGQVIKTTALVKTTPDDEIVITAKSNGIVSIISGDFVSGKSVNSGSTLFSISGNQLSVNNSSVLFAEAQNNYETAKADYERKKELAKDKIISEKELLDAKNKFENARITYENLEQNFNKEGELVESPMNGFIREVLVENGQYVEQGQPLAKIIKNKKLLLQAEIQPKLARMLNNFSDATIRPLGSDQVFDLHQLNGELISFGKTTATDNFLVPANLKIDNSEYIIPGEFVELYLKTTSEESKITIPNSTLLEEQGLFYVFVQKTPELFEKREVEIGKSDGLRTVISKGINAKERVVSEGAMFIKLAQATGTLDAHSGHVH